MLSLARSTLRYEWRRFLPAALAVAFSGVLMLVQLALLLGMFGTVGIYIDRSAADLWAGYPGTRSVDLAQDILERNETMIRMHPEVRAVEPLRWLGATWRTPAGGQVMGIVVGIDTRPGAMAFAHALTPELRARLAEPGAVIVDAGELGKLGVGEGEAAEINGKRVRLVGTVSGLRAIGGVNILTSVATARRLESDSAAARGKTAYLLIRVADPTRAEAVRDALQPQGVFRRYQLWTAAEFSLGSQLYWLLESGAGAGFAFSSLLGLLVGVVITSQTLTGAIVANLREYATLRALGVPTAALARLVLEQAAWVGIVGSLVAVVLSTGLVTLAESQDVAAVLPGWGTAGGALLLLIIAMGSGLLALRALARAEPATLLR